MGLLILWIIVKEIKRKKRKNKAFERLFKILATGSREEIKTAKKEIEILWKTNHKQFEKADYFISEIIENFERILSPEHRAAVISGLYFFYLALSDEHFEKLKNFILKNLRHPDGRVREAARKTGEWLYCSLTDRVRPFVFPLDRPLTEEQRAKQLIAKKQYLNLVAEIENLIELYNDGGEDTEYIDEMKPSVNKSLQMVWSRFTDSRVYRKIIEESRPIPYEILTKRREIEKELAKLLKETKGDYELEDIEEIIYHEDGPDSLTDIIMVFDKGQSAAELQDVLELVNDAWNYFPHKCLNGLSPAEKLAEYRKKENIN